MSTKTTQLWQLNESDIVAAEVVFARRKLSDSHLQSLKVRRGPNPSNNS